MDTIVARRSKLSIALYMVALLAILSGLTLTILSILEVCTSACVEGHKYRLYNLKFEHFGIIFFGIATLFHLFAWKSPAIKSMTGYLLAGGVGGELCFIYVQKYLIGSWCPVCLGIAFSVFIAAFAYAIQAAIAIKHTDQHTTKVSFMKYSTYSTLTVILGFIVAFLGVTKIDPLQARQESLKESITFGDPQSPIEVYVFTDWFCTACHELEPEFKNMAASVERDAKLFFIDANIHDESMNFTPYNLSFMIYDKPKYFDLRGALFDISERTDAPSDALVQSKISPFAVTLKELNYRDIALATKMFAKLKQQFNVTSTPTVIVLNLDTKKGKRISGNNDISKDNIIKAINDLK